MYDDYGGYQAFDRVHRIGQTRAVKIYRLLADVPIEDKLLQLQQKKQAEADAAIESGTLAKKHAAGLSLNEMLQLFE